MENDECPTDIMTYLQLFNCYLMSLDTNTDTYPMGQKTSARQQDIFWRFFQDV